jgi:hypothetical protein
MTNTITKTTSKIILGCFILVFTAMSCNGKSGDADKKAGEKDTLTTPKMDAPTTPDPTKKKDSLSDKPTHPADGLSDKPTAPADAPAPK